MTIAFRRSAFVPGASSLAGVAGGRNLRAQAIAQLIVLLGVVAFAGLSLAGILFAIVHLVSSL